MSFHFHDLIRHMSGDGLMERSLTKLKKPELIHQEREIIKKEIEDLNDTIDEEEDKYNILVKSIEDQNEARKGMRGAKPKALKDAIEKEMKLKEEIERNRKMVVEREDKKKLKLVEKKKAKEAIGPNKELIKKHLAELIERKAPHIINKYRTDPSLDIRKYKGIVRKDLYSNGGEGSFSINKLLIEMGTIQPNGKAFETLILDKYKEIIYYITKNTGPIINNENNLLIMPIDQRQYCIFDFTSPTAFIECKFYKDLTSKSKKIPIQRTKIEGADKWKIQYVNMGGGDFKIFNIFHKTYDKVSKKFIWVPIDANGYKDTYMLYAFSDGIYYYNIFDNEECDLTELVGQFDGNGRQLYIMEKDPTITWKKDFFNNECLFINPIHLKKFI